MELVRNESNEGKIPLKHGFCHPELHNGKQVWRCENCGQVINITERNEK